MATETIVQFSRRRRQGTLVVPMRNPEDILGKVEGAGVVPFTVDLPADDADYLERYAAYRNKFGDLELAEKSEKKAKRGQTWSRKSLSEWLLRGMVEQLRDQMAAVEKALGPIPEGEEALLKYATKAFEMRKKKSA